MKFPIHYRVVLAGIILIVAIALWARFYHYTGDAFISVQAKAQQLAATCSTNTASKEACYSKRMIDVAFYYGPERAFAILKALQMVDSDANGCHFIAHGIGLGTYKRDPAHWQDAVNSISPSCNYGAVHGIIEGYIEQQPTKYLTGVIVPQICGTSPRADCNHIVGHLLLVETKADVKEALKLCLTLQGQTQQQFCRTGVFMEMQTALNLITHGYAPKSWQDWPSRLPELEIMCRAYEGDEALACWEELAHAAAVKFHNNAKEVFAFCDRSPLKEGARRCKRHSIGIMAGAQHFDLDRIKDMCLIVQQGDPGFSQDCYGQLVGSMLSTLPDHVFQAVQYCSALAHTFQSACFAYIGSMMHGVSALKTQASGCNNAPSEFQQTCRGQINEFYEIRGND